MEGTKITAVREMTDDEYQIHIEQQES